MEKLNVVVRKINNKSNQFELISKKATKLTNYTIKGGIRLSSGIEIKEKSRINASINIK